MKFSVGKDEIIVLLEFLTESRDHLEGIEDKVLKLEVSKDTELINSIFRPIHTIKGTSSFLALNNISGLAHELETLLDDIRKEVITDIDAELIDLILEAVDHIARMLASTAAAVETFDHTSDVIEVEIADISDDLVIQRIQARRNAPVYTPPHSIQASKLPENGRPIPETRAAPGLSPELITEQFLAVNAAAMPWAGMDFSAIVFPGHMKTEFESEGDEQIQRIENCLLTLENTPDKTEELNRVFRALHTLKGNTGIILSVIDDENIRKTHYLNQFRELAHIAETIVQKKRDRKHSFRAEEIETLLQVADCLKNLLQCFKESRAPEKPVCHTFALLNEWAERIDKEPEKEEPARIKEIGGDSLAEAISNSMGQLFQAIDSGLERISDENRRDQELKLLRRTYRNLAKIADRIQHPLLTEKCREALNLLDFMALRRDENEDRFIHTLRADFALIREKGDRRRNRELPDRRKSTLPPPTTDKELEMRITDKVLKVSQEKIDTFMNLIGELLVGKNNLYAFEREVALNYDLPEIARRLKECADNISRVSNELQSSIMEIRMMPVAGAFSKFPRMIRDLSKKLDKNIQLLISGEETEVDKNVIEALVDPLVHMIRNAADHGMETRAERLKKGKPEAGVIRLNAYNQGQYVVIQVSDDGRGMDADRIKKRAVERRLLAPDEAESMDNQQALQLIMLPGFSMADEVSDVSGRGVGMDVVKTNVEKLGGEIHISSAPGQGSEFTIKLPLTMAVGRGLEVAAEGNRYFIPLEAIVETLRLPLDSVFRYKGREMTVVRDQLLPVFRLGERLGLTSSLNDSYKNRKNLHMVILSVKNRRIGLIVDGYFSEYEYVVKPLTGALANIEGISGAMITGEGKVHLILDLARLF